MTNHKPKAESRSDEAEGPDGGWGWVLVGALFVSTSLVFGLMRSLGIFFVEFVQYFEESAQAISWISSTGLAAQQFFSPLGAALCNAYDTRVVVMIGGFLSGLGLILASQATCLVHLYLTMGVISGLLKDVTGKYIASFMVAGSFLILGTLTMATLPHYFSCTDPPAPRRRSHDDKDKSFHSELEKFNSSPSHTSHGGAQ